jgi:lipopolysaccharide exporter
MSSVGKEITRGGLWMLLFKVADRVLAIVGMAVLARLLTPADFGLVAMATVVIEAVELATTFSFDMALIRDASNVRERYDSAWTLNVLLAVGCAVVLLFVTAPAAAFYSEPRLETLMPMLAVGMAVRGFENIGTVAFRKELDFRKEFIFLTSKRVANFVAAVVLAIWLRSYWALALSIVISRMLGVLLSYAMHPYRPTFSLAEARPLLRFSKWLLFSNLIWFLYGRLPDLIIGRIAGPHQVGLYSGASDIARMPTTEIVAPINRAVYPGYAKHGNDVGALTSTYLAVVAAIWTLTLPAALGMSLVAQPFVLLFLGEQWLEMTPLIRVLAIAGFCGLIVSNQYYVYLALGRASIITRLSVIQLAAMIAGIVLLAPRFGALGVAYAALFSAMLDVPIGFSIFIRATNTGWSDVWRAAWRPVLASGLMTLTLLALYPSGIHATGEWDALQTLSAAVLAGAATYLVALLGAWLCAGRPEGPESQLLRLVQNRLLAARSQKSV